MFDNAEAGVLKDGDGNYMFPMTDVSLVRGLGDHLAEKMDNTMSNAPAGVVGNDFLAANSITPDKINWQSFDGMMWIPIGSDESTSAVTNGRVCRVVIPERYRSASLKFNARWELSVDGWLDLRTYDASGNLLHHTINRIGCVNGGVQNQGVTGGNYIATTISTGQNYKASQAVGVAVRNVNCGNYRSWVSAAGNGYGINVTSCLQENGNPVASIELWTGGTCSPKAYLKVWGMYF